MRFVYLEGGGHDRAAPQQPPHVLAIGDLAASRLTAHRVLPTVQFMDECRKYRALRTADKTVRRQKYLLKKSELGSRINMILLLRFRFVHFTFCNAICFVKLYVLWRLCFENFTYWKVDVMYIYLLLRYTLWRLRYVWATLCSNTVNISFGSGSDPSEPSIRIMAPDLAPQHWK